MEELDAVIVGGGLHAVHLAVALGSRGLLGERWRIIDPGERLLSVWRARTGGTGMRHLRSGARQHLDPAPRALLRFAGASRLPRGAFAGASRRPSLALFNAHCDDLIARHKLAQRHVRDRIEALELCEGGLLLRGATGCWRVRRAILALGDPRPLRWPSWAQEQRGAPGLRHAFEARTGGAGRTLIVGAGVSAAQLALRLASEGREVTVIRRHPWRVHELDADPRWLDERQLQRFRGEGVEARRQQLDAARFEGSLPAELYRALKRRVEAGRILEFVGQVHGLRAATDGWRLETCGGRLAGAQLVLATGLAGSLALPPWLRDAAAAAGLPISPCGLPVLDAELRWHPRLLVTGALAELQLGALARNIAGARLAARRMTAALEGGALSTRRTPRRRAGPPGPRFPGARANRRWYGLSHR